MSASVAAADPRATRSAIEALAPWFHNLHLPDGEQTAPNHPLGDFPSFKWRQIAPHVPDDLDGLQVLDIGCNAGFYSFQLAARGARVTAIDIDPHYLAQARWASRRFGLEDRIEFRCMQLYDLARERSQFDLVWFMGVPTCGIRCSRSTSCAAAPAACCCCRPWPCRARRWPLHRRTSRWRNAIACWRRDGRRWPSSRNG